MWRLVGWFYGVSTLFGPFNAELIQFSISKVFVCKQLNVKTDLFQTIQLSISMQFSSIWPRDRTLSGAITPSQSGPGSDGNEGVFRILQSFSITETSPSDCLVSYLGHSLGGVLSLCRDSIGVFYCSSRLGRSIFVCEGWGITPLQRCSWSILQPQLTGQFNNVKKQLKILFKVFFVFFLFFCSGIEIRLTGIEKGVWTLNRIFSCFCICDWN